MIHIDAKSGFSFLKAYGSPEQIISRAKEIGAPAIGLADFCSTWGHIPFVKEAKKHGIKPLLGVQIPVVGNLEKDPRHDLITLIAKTTNGLHEQYKALGLATEQFYYRPRITWEQLRHVKDNYLIVNRITPDTVHYLRDFPPEILMIALSPTPGYTLRVALSGDYPAIVACSPLYPRATDEETYRLVRAAGDGRKTAEIDRTEAWIFSADEVEAKFFEIGIQKQNAISLEAFVDTIDAELPVGINVKPGIDITVEDWCVRGAKERGIDLSVEPYKSRYEKEIALIHEKGFVDYFLLIADLVAWAKRRMFVGPARGSSAGSLVCYLMGIVEVDPLVHGLLFERFIDVNRKDLPDVDIDFPDERRDEVFSYLAGKYGEARVARIGTISVFKPKSALNDVGKCYDIPPWEIKKLTEVLVERSGGDARANMAIEDTIAQFDVGKDLLSKFPSLNMAARIEGHPRHTGIHAAGVIVSNDDVSRYCAINKRRDADGHSNDIAMINKNDAETLGLLKIDALGLKTLSVIQDCCDQVGIDPRELYNLPTDIEEAFEPFKSDRVAGIFQFEGYAVRSLMRQMGVENFNDIVALTALARPGPLHCGAANEFIERRTGRVDWDYGIPELQPHVAHTFGTIVYQEQVMSITRDLGAMDWQDVSALRKAMSKSMGEEFFNQFEIKFLKGTDAKGIDHAKAKELWKNMCTFGSWAFNLSHAVSYALISYWCGYLKQKFPLEFAVAHLRRTASEDHVLRLLRELLKEGYKFIPFDANRSEISWSIKDGKIFGGLTAVKGIGEATARGLLEERQKDPANWLSNIAPSKRAKLLAPNNTPWHTINRMEKIYGELYRDPENFRSERLPQGIKGKLWKIEEIEEKKGNYCFIGQLKQRNLRDLNETQSLAKRNGQVMKRNNLFLNLTFDDDTGSILATIDRWKYPTLGVPIMEEASDGHDFLIRGNIIEDGRRKIYINKILRLT